MSLTAWIILSLTFGDLHADADSLRAAARRHGVPANSVMLPIAAVEGGYSGRNDIVGKAGERGRMQIELATAQTVGCPEPEHLEQYAYNVDCGARILRYCRDRYGSWPLAIRCYQGLGIPEGTKDYLRRVEQELGHEALARLR